MFEGQPQADIDALIKADPEFKQLYQRHRELDKKVTDAELGVLPIDDNRKFTELYPVQRLKSAYIAGDSAVCISTIQRMYSILSGEPIDESAEDMSLNELQQIAKQEDVLMFPIHEYWLDIGRMDDFHKAQLDIKGLV